MEVPSESRALPMVVLEEARQPVAVSLAADDLQTLTPAQQANVMKLRQGFADAMAPMGDEDPDSPGYFEKWKHEQRAHDEQLRLTLGWEKFNLLSARAARQTDAPR